MTDDEIIDGIERSEGWPAFSDNPADFGGPTKGGITLDTLRAWRRNPLVTARDLEALDEPEARAIYQFMFLQPFATIPDEPLRYFLVDLGVLTGPRHAAIVLQQIVGALPADGWIGPETLACLKPLERSALLMAIGSRFTDIEGVIKQTPSQAQFRGGWRARNARFLP